MHYLEISYIGSACGKNRFEPKNKTLLLLLARRNKDLIKSMLFNKKIIQEEDENTRVYDAELKDIYSEYKKKITDVTTINSVKEDIIKKLKTENTEITDKDILVATKFLDNTIKKDCGNNTEGSVIKSKMYTKGNNYIHTFTEKTWELRGLHDATQDDIVIEIKTRMKVSNVRKNDYDLYQLFGYMLAMGKTKGKIVQTFQGDIWDSDIENSKEFGLVDIENDLWKTKFECFKTELYLFFDTLNYICEDIVGRFDIESVFENCDLPIAKIYRGVAKNVDNNYEKIIKTLF